MSPKSCWTWTFKVGVEDEVCVETILCVLEVGKVVVELAVEELVEVAVIELEAVEVESEVREDVVVVVLLDELEMA